MYLRYDGPLKPSRKRAVKLFREAADGSEPDPSALYYLAYYELGDWMWFGSSLPSAADKADGLRHLRQSADLGDPEAQTALGRIAWREKDTAKAETYLARAAASRLATAQVAYGRFLECKSGVSPAERQLALENYDSAARADNKIAAAASNRLRAGLLLAPNQCNFAAAGYPI